MKKIGRTVVPSNKPVHFPIERDISICGTTHHKTMNRDAVVKCIFCNDIFRVNDSTTFQCEDFQYLECPFCGKYADVVYYFDRTIQL